MHLKTALLRKVAADQPEEQPVSGQRFYWRDGKRVPNPQWSPVAKHKDTPQKDLQGVNWVEFGTKHKMFGVPNKAFGKKPERSKLREALEGFLRYIP
jgi:hypothetical protein